MNRRFTIIIIVVTLICLVVIAANLIALPATAVKFNGPSPFTATEITDYRAGGTVAPESVGWHKLTYQGTAPTSTLALRLTPTSAHTVEDVTLTVHRASQLERWYAGDSATLDDFGTTFVFYPDNSGELVWNGLITINDIYFIRIVNHANFNLDYDLTTTNTDPDFDADYDAPNTDTTTPTPSPSSKANLPIVMSLAPSHTSLHEGKLDANQTRWFALDTIDLTIDPDQNFNLTVFATPGGNTIHDLTIDLYRDTDTTHSVSHRLTRDDDSETAQLTWQGTIAPGNRYLVRLKNDNNMPINYWLFIGNTLQTNTDTDLD